MPTMAATCSTFNRLLSFAAYSLDVGAEWCHVHCTELHSARSLGRELHGEQLQWCDYVLPLRYSELVRNQLVCGIRSPLVCVNSFSLEVDVTLGDLPVPGKPWHARNGSTKAHSMRCRHHGRLTQVVLPRQRICFEAMRWLQTVQS